MTRNAFTQRLVRNIREALRQEGIPFQIRKEWSRLFVETPEPLALEVLQRVFGIRSLSVVERVRVTGLSHLVEEGEKLFAQQVQGKSFAVRARRSGGPKDPRFRSTEIGRTLGARLLPYSRGVNLSQPDVTVNVEMHGDVAYFFADVRGGAGGLPLACHERALALVSGGFDSAVAAWLGLKRGIALDYLIFNLGGSAHLASALPVLKTLSDRWSYGDSPRLHVVDFHAVVHELQARVEPRYWQVVLKRLMVKMACEIAKECGSLALVTGEAVGQVSSQTLSNLHVISRAADLPILRPVVSFDKHEIIALAQQIGTAGFSQQVEEYCALAARHPATSASLQEVEDQERKIDAGVLSRALAEKLELDLRQMPLATSDGRELEIEEIPEGAQILDLRPIHSFRAWSFPGAIHTHFFAAMDHLESLGLDRDRVVVAYCEVGVKSAQLAERLRGAGFRAYHFRGGMHSLMRYALLHDQVAPELLPPSAWQS